MVIDFSDHMYRYGWDIFPRFVAPDLIERLKKDLTNAYDICREVQVKNGINVEGASHHILNLGGSFIELLESLDKMDEYLSGYFGGKYIINTFGGNILKSGMSYANYIHRDIRSFSGSFNLMLNMVVMLDDFTEDNGATWLMGLGHKYRNRPIDELFDKHKFQIVGNSGDIVVFNSNMWHMAGENKTDSPRMALTPIFSKPFIKPQFDYPRAFGYHMGDGFSPYVRQLLGYNARVPKTLGEWYSENRFYKKDQE